MTQPSLYTDDDASVMTAPPLCVGDQVVVHRQHLPYLFDLLQAQGYQLIGPTICDNAIIYDEIDSVDDLPAGWTDDQTNGSYRLSRRADAALFGYNVGPQSWKKFLHPPLRRLWQARRGENGFTVTNEPVESPRRAFIGVRSCDLHAIAIQDRVFLQSGSVDPSYNALRDNTFILAVNCGQAGGTCFCASLQTGPQASGGFDLALTELCDGDQHIFLVEIGSEAGADLLQEVPHEPADEHARAAARHLLAETAAHMGRTLNTEGLPQRLYNNYEHPHWDNVAERCLTCGNCTSVCPTCFCVTVEDVTDLSGNQAERWQRWDSCFTTEFSYIHGGSVRTSEKARYRQWLTHKFAAWIDQFGMIGCVGCGRCITWCPVGIDVTAELRALSSTT